MTIKILASKVKANSIAKNRQELNQGYRMKNLQTEEIDRQSLESMIERLRKLAHAKDPSDGTVNQTNLESARMTSKKLSAAVENIDIASNQAIKENPLISTVCSVSNVLKFKRTNI